MKGRMAAGVQALVTALFFSALEAKAQEIQNAPLSIIGTFGKSRAQCQSHHRKSDDLSRITSTEYTFCGGTGCTARILSHHKTKEGFVIRLVSRGRPEGFKWTVRQVDDDVFEQQYEDGNVETLVRCSMKDSIAGIGLPEYDGLGKQSKNVEFAAYYAKAIPSVCSAIGVREQEVDRVLIVARSALIERRQKQRLVRPSVSPEADADEMMEWQRRGAQYAVTEDAKAIPDFCKEVLEAFGADGRLLPNLLVDPRQKT